MNKGLNIFLVVLLCVVVYIGLLLSFYSSKNVETSNPYLGDVKSTRGTYGTYAVSANSMGSNMATISVRSANSIFHHRPVFSYAPAASMPTYSVSGGSRFLPSREGVGVGSQAPLYTTSSAEFRSFGGGGNGGGVSMSGGVATSSGAALATGLTTTMPSTSMYAYSNDRNPSSVVTNDWMSSVSGGIAMASTSSYAGIGQTTGGASRAVAGRHNVPGVGGNQYYGWLTSDWNEDLGKGWGYSSGGGVTIAELQELFYNMTGQTHFENPQAWEAFLNWFKSQMNADGKVVFGDYTWYLPLSDAIPFVLLLCLLYALAIYRKTRKRVV